MNTHDTISAPRPAPDAGMDAHDALTVQAEGMRPHRTRRDTMLLATCLLAALLVDRLVIHDVETENARALVTHIGLLTASWPMAVHILFRKSIRRRPSPWILGSELTALGIWCMLYGTGPAYHGNREFMTLSALAAPGLAMLHLQVSAGADPMQRPRGTAMRWLRGWFIEPFSALGCIPDALAAPFAARGGHVGEGTGRGLAIGVLCSLPVLMAATPLLTSSDEVFAWYFADLMHHADIRSATAHGIIVASGAALLFSLLRNADRHATAEAHATAETDSAAAAKTPRRRTPLNPTACATMLAIVGALYAAFCSTQLAFLFAGRGLPAGYTYADYARQGFWQLLAVTAINLALYGICLSYAPRRRPLVAALAVLILCTAVILASAFTRLHLYIGTYGLTWLRLTALTLMGYLAVVLLLCAIRLAGARIPLAAITLMLAPAWFVALGYADPHHIIDACNAAMSFGYTASSPTGGL